MGFLGTTSILGVMTIFVMTCCYDKRHSHCAMTFDHRELRVMGDKNLVFKNPFLVILFRLCRIMGH